MSIIHSLGGLVFAPVCASCDHRLGPAQSGLCATCAISLYPIDAACRLCALPFASPGPALCAACTAKPPPVTAASASFLYGGELANALVRLKFSRREDIARALADLIRPGLSAAAAGADLIVPVPLHWRRRASRGFNQASELVRWAAMDVGADIDRLSLRRVRPTPPQTGLPARARADNVRGAFSVPPVRRRRIRARRVLLVDDVMTTGATCFAAAEGLLEAGAAQVAVYAVARAEPP